MQSKTKETCKIKQFILMEITGKVIGLLPEYRTQGGKVKYSFLLETNNQFPQKVPFEVWGEEKWSNMRIVEGADVVVSFDVSGREYNGKHYVSLQAWKVVHTGTQQQAHAQQAQAAVQAETAPVSDVESGGEQGDLPF